MVQQQGQKETTAEQLNTFTVDSYRRQLIGVTTSEVLCQNLIKTIHAGALHLPCPA
jgi:Cu(I)/Ag(I) efflux system membrane fusion protein